MTVSDGFISHGKHVRQAYVWFMFMQDSLKRRKISLAKSDSHRMWHELLKAAEAGEI